MAGRVLRRAAALGIAAATVGSLHALATWKPPQPITTTSYSTSAKHLLVDTAAGLQAAVLRAQPLSGAHLRSVRAQAEKDLARADAEGGDPATAADLRLLLALLAARDGRTDEALQRYADAARDAPFDPRPRALAHALCVMARRPPSEASQWRTAYRRLVPYEEGKGKRTPGLESDETAPLVHELIIAAGLGGVYDLRRPEDRKILMRLSCGEVDAWLAAALQDETLSTAERLQLSALRVYLHAKVRLLETK